MNYSRCSCIVIGPLPSHVRAGHQGHWQSCIKHWRILFGVRQTGCLPVCFHPSLEER